MVHEDANNAATQTVVAAAVDDSVASDITPEASTTVYDTGTGRVVATATTEKHDNHVQSLVFI